MDKHQLSERDICTKFITPAIQQAGWQQHQFREEVNLTDGRVMVRGTLAARVKNPDAKGGPKRADYVLYARPNIPIAVVEAKQAKFAVGHGMQQALAYAEMLDAPFAISSNGKGFLLHDRTGLTQPIERELALTEFPFPDDLWPLYQQWKGLAEATAVKLVEQPFYTDGSGKEPRYYQRVAINLAIEAIAKGQQRVLLVMATGTGKTYTAFQIIWRLWKAKAIFTPSTEPCNAGEKMAAKNTSLVAISTALAIVLLVAIGLITYKHFSNKEEARLLLSQGKKENITISNKRIKNRFSIYQWGVPRMIRTYLLSGFINTADNSKFGVVDPSCKVDVAKGQFCMADFSAGFKVNLENIEMVVTHETYHEMQEGDKIEVYCMKVDGKHICKPTKTVHSYFD